MNNGIDHLVQQTSGHKQTNKAYQMGQEIIF